MTNIYLATSWRNPYQELVLSALREDGHEVYDFKHPKKGVSGFSWGDVADNETIWAPNSDGLPEKVHVTSYKKMIEHPRAREGFDHDMDALDASEICVCVLPCGNSAHLELGWAAGREKLTAIISDQLIVPDLMYHLVDYFTNDLTHLRKWCLAPTPRYMAVMDIVPA